MQYLVWRENYQKIKLARLPEDVTNPKTTLGFEVILVTESHDEAQACLTAERNKAGAARLVSALWATTIRPRS